MTPNNSPIKHVPSDLFQRAPFDSFWLTASYSVPSQQYLQTEVENVLSALGTLAEHFESGAVLTLDAEWIQEQNRRVLAGLNFDEHVTPGEYTTTPLVVGTYRGAPPEDIPLLVNKLLRWLDELTTPEEGQPENLRFFQAFLAATLGHLYLAWIHPFGDGNGRTARLLECAILTRSGLVPWCRQTCCLITTTARAGSITVGSMRHHNPALYWASCTMPRLDSSTNYTSRSKASRLNKCGFRGSTMCTRGSPANPTQSRLRANARGSSHSTQPAARLTRCAGSPLNWPNATQAREVKRLAAT
ncbi:MAG: hypothetical protein DLM55_00140 [Acidimicrobiales bacterium]|nr:MAG: hypothetical protein DLM55_00140 [Acidimicrobiales bacterium]